MKSLGLVPMRVDNPIEVSLRRANLKWRGEWWGMCRSSAGRGRRESFTICEMDDINVVLDLTFLEAYNGVFKGKKCELVIQSDSRELVLPLTKSSRAFGGRLNFISARKLSEKCYMLVMQAREAKDGNAEKVELVPKYVEDVLKRYQDVMLELLLNKLPPRREVDYKVKVKPGTEPPSKHHIVLVKKSWKS